MWGQYSRDSHCVLSPGLGLTTAHCSVSQCQCQLLAKNWNKNCFFIFIETATSVFVLFNHNGRFEEKINLSPSVLIL